jgi:hypothetical protein
MAMAPSTSTYPACGNVVEQKQKIVRGALERDSLGSPV